MKPCECGCGQPAPIATRTRTDRGQTKGLPIRFISGHNPPAPGVVPPPTPRVDRYEIDDNGCWVWWGAKSGYGYGRLMVDGKFWRAHRWYYEQSVGPIPEGLELDHLCRTPACVNPAHMEPVTRLENAQRSGMSGMNEATVRAIKAARAAGMTCTEISKRYDLSYRDTWDLCNGLARYGFVRLYEFHA